MQQARKAASNQPQVYERHRPEQTLLYQLVETHYPELLAHLEAQGQALLAYIQQEFDVFLKCGRLEHGFLRVCCEDCKHERLVAFSGKWVGRFQQEHRSDRCRHIDSAFWFSIESECSPDQPPGDTSSGKERMAGT